MLLQAHYVLVTKTEVLRIRKNRASENLEKLNKSWLKEILGIFPWQWFSTSATVELATGPLELNPYVWHLRDLDIRSSNKPNLLVHLISNSEFKKSVNTRQYTCCEKNLNMGFSWKHSLRYYVYMKQNMKIIFCTNYLTMGLEFSNVFYNVLLLFVNNNSPYSQTPLTGSVFSRIGYWKSYLGLRWTR